MDFLDIKSVTGRNFSACQPERDSNSHFQSVPSVSQSVTQAVKVYVLPTQRISQVVSQSVNQPGILSVSRSVVQSSP